jgi:hypothetical protein
MPGGASIWKKKKEKKRKGDSCVVAIGSNVPY